MLVQEVSDRHHTEPSHGTGAAPRTAATNSVCVLAPLLFIHFCIFIKHDGLADRPRTVAQQWTGGATARHHHVVECIIRKKDARNISDFETSKFVF
jgi:hypothetical protein